MDRPEQALIQNGFDCNKLTRKTALKTNADVNATLFDGFFDTLQVLRFQADWFFNNELFPRLCGKNAMLSMLVRKSADRYYLKVRIGKHPVQLIVDPNWNSELPAQLSRIERTPRANGGNLPQARRIDCRDMCRCSPAETDNAHVVFFHARLLRRIELMAIEVVLTGLPGVRNTKLHNCLERP